MGQAVRGGPRGNNVRQEKEAIVTVNRMILNKRCHKKTMSLSLDLWVLQLEQSMIKQKVLKFANL
jgi:hypothetical protein